MRRHKAHGGGHAEGNGERWLLTYADMITLLLALFVLLFSMSQTDVQRFKAAMDSVQSALGRTPPPSPRPIAAPAPPAPARGPMGPGPKPFTSAAPPHPIEDQMAAFTEAIRKQGLEHDVHVLRANSGVIIRLQDDILFNTGEAALRPGAAPVIDRVVALLAQLTGYSVTVEGFTDTRPIATPEFPSNWELSAARALSVLHALVAAGIDPEILSASGFGEYHAVAPETTEEGRAQNRRVEIVVSRLVEKVGP
ncbi:MAG: flagellar motor protein MotB [bacterium]